MRGVGGNVVTCKRDGKTMLLVKEVEKLSNGEQRVTYSYKCPLCGYTVSVEQLTVKKQLGNGGGVEIVKKSLYSSMNVH